jgi:hypothetical protein
MGIVPSSRPQSGLLDILTRIQDANCMSQVCLVGIRGYYNPGNNQRDIYDDCIALHTPDHLITFNANCDPGVHKPGVATLQDGTWLYKIGIHGLSKPANRQYEALVQSAPVVVYRDGKSDMDRGFFGINIHRGGYNSVSSEGCQTIYPSQWEDFIRVVKNSMKDFSQKEIPYILGDA